MIRNCKEIHMNDVAIVGGKGANLEEMTNSGITVPEGFVVTSDAYRLFLKENNLEELLRTELEEAGNDEAKLLQCAKDFREKIRAGKLPKVVQEQVAKEYGKLGARARVAVRSSATAEDLPDASFAGQQETYLNVVGLEEILAQIRNCYASLWENRAVVYRQNQGYDQESVAMAVIVQHMVESEVAGVLFTVDPITMNSEKMQINASYGLGESVVSGRVTADSYVCDKSGRLLDCVIGSKETQIIYSDGDSGTKEVAVEKTLQMQRACDDEMIQKLCEAGITVERYYKMPMDIEWGICDKKVYILQARAITTLQKETSPAEEALIQKYLDKCICTGKQRQNMAFLLEKIPYVYYPFDYELIEIIGDQKSEIFKEIGVIMNMHPQIDDDGIMILPPNGKKFSRYLIQFPSVMRELKNLSECRDKLEKQMKGFRKELLVMQNVNYKQMTIEACGESFTYMSDFIRRITYSRFKYALFPSVLYKGKLAKVLKKVDNKISVFDVYQNLASETVVMGKDLETIALKFAKNDKLKTAILEGMNYQDLRKHFPETKADFDRFLEKHGFKSDFNCYCIAAKAFNEDPGRILHLILPLLEKKPVEEKNRFEQMMEQLKDVAGDKKYEMFRKNIDIIRYMHIIREESQMMWETCFYYIKKVLKRASFLLCAHEDYMQDLAYLFLSELVPVCKHGKLEAADLEKIQRRKEKRPLAEKVWDRVKLKVFPDTGDTLKGVSGSVGEVVGKSRIISGPEEFYKFQKGDVLVCKLTDPEWTPLFSLASAVVADTGAGLSHAAIVAREYGIPTVLGVGYATTRYQDGDMLLVNGTKGEVSKVEG